VISLLALFISLAGTSVAAVPPVKRALFAANAGKLQGKKLKDVAAMPGPARSVGDLVFARTVDRVLAPRQETDVTASCGASAKAISGGIITTGDVSVGDSRASTDNAWTYFVRNFGASAARVTVQVVCLR
jgi:hypothetical protein